MESPSTSPARRSRHKFSIGKHLDRLRTRKRALIYTHDNPDPDSLAAAWGLARLFQQVLGVDCQIAHGGIVGRAQNRAMVENLGIKLINAETLDLAQFDLVALVDSQPETGNNSLPLDGRIDVVIDHHPPRPESRRAPWCDIRPELGATSTIVFEYLRTMEIPMDAPLATAFLFALRTETRDLGRESTAQERHAYLALIPMVDHALLYRMTHPKVPRAHFAALDRALRSAEIYGNIVAVNLGRLGYPDLVAEIADLLLSYDQAKLVLCAGRYDGNAYLSLRAEPTQRRAGSMMRAIVGTSGAAGGHGTMAGARLFAKIRSARDLEAAFQRLVGNLCDATNQEGQHPTPLLPRTRHPRPRPANGAGERGTGSGE